MTDENARYLQRRALAYAYFHGRIDMTVKLAEQGVYEAAQTLRELRAAVVQLDEKLAAAREAEAVPA